MARKQTPKETRRIVLIVDGEENYRAYLQAQETFLGHLKAGNDLAETLEFAFQGWCEALGFEVRTAGTKESGIDEPAGSIIVTLPDREYNEWAKVSENAWRPYVDQTGIDFAAAIDNGIEEGLRFVRIDVYPESDSPAVSEDKPAPKPEAPSRKGRFTAGVRAKAQANVDKAIARDQAKQEKRALAKAAGALNGGKGHINGLANGAAAH
jgi:hypothetical protein